MVRALRRRRIAAAVALVVVAIAGLLYLKSSSQVAGLMGTWESDKDDILTIKTDGTGTESRSGFETHFRWYVTHGDELGVSWTDATKDSEQDIPLPRMANGFRFQISEDGHTMSATGTGPADPWSDTYIKH